MERVKYWLEKGAKPSATIFNLLVKAGLATGAKQKSVYLSGKRKTKIAEKKKAAAPPPARSNHSDSGPEAQARAAA